jgi:hypothetical protein
MNVKGESDTRATIKESAKRRRQWKMDAPLTELATRRERN